MRTRIPIIATALAAGMTALAACTTPTDSPSTETASHTEAAPATSSERGFHELPQISKEGYAQRVSRTKVTCASPYFTVRPKEGQEEDAQLVTASLHTASPGTDEVRLEFYPQRPYGVTSLKVDPFTMEVTNSQEHLFRLVYRGPGDMTATVDTPMGYHKDVSEYLRFSVGVASGELVVPLLSGFVSPGASLDKLTLQVEGTKDKATCVPLMGSSVTVSPTPGSPKESRRV